MLNGRCRMHGGTRVRGLAHHSISQNGRYSKHLPTRILATYDASKADPDLLNLRDDIAAVDGRIADVLSRVDTGESGQLWHELKATYKAMQNANKAGDIGEARTLLSELGSLINRGHLDYAAWSDVRNLIEQRRKLVDSEGKRLEKMQQMITGEQAVLLIARVYDSVARHVTDPTVHAAIAADLGGLTAQSVSGDVQRPANRNGRTA